jgi:hypothetical protein
MRSVSMRQSTGGIPYYPDRSRLQARGFLTSSRQQPIVVPQAIEQVRHKTNEMTDHLRKTLENEGRLYLKLVNLLYDFLTPPASCLLRIRFRSISLPSFGIIDNK